MNKKLHISISIMLTIALVAALAVVFTAATSDVPSIVLRDEAQNLTISDPALRLANEIINRKILSGSFTKYFPGSTSEYTSTSEFEIGRPYPVIMVYNPSVVGYDQNISANSFSSPQVVSEWLFLIYQKNGDHPLLYFNIASGDNTNWRESEFGTASVGGISTCIEAFEKVRLADTCSEPIIIRFNNEYGIVYRTDNIDSVMISSLLAHELKIPGSFDAIASIPLCDFIKYANDAIDLVSSGTGLDG